MKKFWIILGSIVGSLLVIAYLCFLFVLPNAIDLNQYKPMVQDLVKEQIPLNVDFKNAKITVTPLLSVGVKAEDISVKFEDGKTLFSADKAKFRVALPSLLCLTVKLSTAEIDNPKLDFTIVDGKQFKVLMLVEKILQDQENMAQKDEAQTEMPFDTSIIRIKVPNFKLNNYDVTIDDTKSGHKLELKGDCLKLGYFNGKVVKAKTNAELYSDENKNITADIDINTFLPEMEGLDEDDDKPERIELPFVNPVLMYRQYDLKSNVATKLKVREKDGQIRLNGFLNIDDTTLKLGSYQLPKCYFHGIFKGTKVNLDTDISVAKDKNITASGMFDYKSAKDFAIDMELRSDKIYFQDLITIAKAYLDSLHIRHDLNLIKCTGYFSANATIKLTKRKNETGGNIIIRDGGIVNKNINLGITKTNANFSFEEGLLAIKDTYTYINNAILKVGGNIDNDAVVNLTVDADKIPISGLYRAFAPRDLKKSISINGGNLSIGASVKGELRDATCDLNAELENFLMRDTQGSMRVANDSFNIGINRNPEEKTCKIRIQNKGLNVLFPQLNSTIKDSLLSLLIENNKIILNPTNVIINNNSKITFSGLIDTNKEEQIFSVDGKGTLNAIDLKKFAGNQAAPFIDAKGNIPVTLAIKGNMKRQNLLLRLLGDSNNYITPIKLDQTYGKNTLLQAKIDFKGDRLKIKDTGLFTRKVTIDEEKNEVEELDEVLGLDGTITSLHSRPFINILRVRLTQDLSGSLAGFRNSGFNAKGKMIIYGFADSPRMRGDFTIDKVFIRDLLTTMNSLKLQFRGKSLNVNANNINLNGSDISSTLDVSLVPSNITEISNLRVNSRNIDLDRLMTVATVASRMIPPSNTPTTAPTSIPVSLTNSSINLRHIKTGNIHVYNTNARIALHRSIFMINRLSANAFGGNINGRISMNLLNNLLRIKVNGDNLNTEKLLLDTANMKDTLNGKLAFDTDISIDAGATDFNKQMESLAGNVHFLIQDGQFGPFGKLENMILAENIRESQFFQTAIGGMVNGMTSIDTTHFKELKGSLTFKDGVTTINPITSDGNVLTLYIAGDFDLLKNTCDMHVRGRLASMVSNVLGPLANVNPVNLVKVTPGMNVASAKMFTLFTQPVTQTEMDAIPEFKTKTDNLNATKFQIVVKGDVAKPLSLVKSFKWLALQSDIDTANSFVATLPEPETLDSTVEQIEAQQVEEAKTSTKIKNFFFRKNKKEAEQKKLETQEALKKMQEDAKENQ